MNPQAEELNEIIKKNSPAIYELLSEKGRGLYFPKKGIISQSAEAKGKKINATIGIALEDDGSPMRLESISKNIALEPKDVFPYAPSYGKPELRELWQKFIYKKNPSLKGPVSMPVATQALTHGLSVISHLFINPGDAIILTDKFWENYNLIFEEAYGAKLKTFETFLGSGFNVEELKQTLSEKSGKKILLLNFPNNPTGYTPTEAEVHEIIEIIKKQAETGDKILVICDDAYFGLVYGEGVCKESVFAHLANLHENVLAVKIDGATKEDYVWGLRVGFITYARKGTTEETCKALESKTAGAIRGNLSNISNISQSLLLKAFTSPEYEQEKQEKFAILRSRYMAVKEALKNKEFEKYFKPLPFNSGYFMCVELNEGLDAEKIRQKLLSQYDTGVVAQGNLLRIAYSSVKADDIPVLFKNIYNACRPKITIVGAGNVGSQAAFYSALKNLGEIVLIDIVEGLAKGKALDISESLPVAGTDTKIIGGEDYSLTQGSDIVVITAGIARKPGMSRDDLVNTNASIMRSIIPEVARHSPNCILIIVSNPLDIMVDLAYKLSGFPKNRVLGMAGVLDTARFKAFLRDETGASANEIEAVVLGGHGDLMVPVIGSCKINGKPLGEALSKEKLDEIVKRVQNGGAEIVGLLKTGSAFFAPGLSIVEMSESILNDLEKVLPCSVLLEGEYGMDGVFAGVPARLGKNGVEKIIEIPLSPEEKKLFKKSVEHIRKMVSVIPPLR